jgi:hypothetical protein
VVEGGYAPDNPATRWSLKDLPAALESNRFDPDLRWSRLGCALAGRSCHLMTLARARAYSADASSSVSLWVGMVGLQSQVRSEHCRPKRHLPFHNRYIDLSQTTAH